MKYRRLDLKLFNSLVEHGFQTMDQVGEIHSCVGKIVKNIVRQIGHMRIQEQVVTGEIRCDCTMVGGKAYYRFVMCDGQRAVHSEELEEKEAADKIQEFFNKVSR